MAIPTGLTDLLESERGIFCVAALFAATVLVVLGRVDATQWLDFTKYLAGALLASKAVTTAVETATRRPKVPTAVVVVQTGEGEQTPAPS